MNREPIFTPNVMAVLREKVFLCSAIGGFTVGYLLSFAMILAGAGAFLVACAHWLKTGIWVPEPVSNYLPDLTPTGWVGLDLIIDWFWDIPAFLGAAGAGLALIFFMSAILDGLRR